MITQNQKKHLLRRTNNYQCAISAFKKHTLHGKGNFGQVYMAENKQTNQIVAIKKIKKITNSQQGLSVNFIRQLSILKKLNHPNIIKLLNFSANENDSDGFLVLQYMSSDLQKQLMKRYLTMSEIKKILKSILSALVYCHANYIMHRDIKPSNILINPQNMQCKIADFGIAKQVHQNPKNNTTKIAALYYRAPELLLQISNYDYEIDIWGVGCIFAQCLLGKILMKSSVVTQLSQLIMIIDVLGIPCSNIPKDIQKIKEDIHIIKQCPIQKSFKQLNKILTPIGLDLLNKMLSFDPQKRITAKQALQHPFFHQENIQTQQQTLASQISQSMIGQI